MQDDLTKYRKAQLAKARAAANAPVADPSLTRNAPKMREQMMATQKSGISPRPIEKQISYLLPDRTAPENYSRPLPEEQRLSDYTDFQRSRPIGSSYVSTEEMAMRRDMIDMLMSLQPERARPSPYLREEEDLRNRLMELMSLTR